MARKNKDKKTWGPIVAIGFLTLAIIVLSAVFSLLEIEGQKAAIVNGSLEVSMITVQNFISMEGIRYLFSNVVLNFSLFEPMFLFIIGLIVVGVGMASGLFQAVLSPLKKVKPIFISGMVLFISIISTMLGDNGYALLLPFVAVMYQCIGRNPILGILTAFLGITVGYGTGIFYNFDQFTMGSLTQIAATADVDKNYKFHLLSSLYIVLTSTIVLTVLGSIIVERFLATKFKKQVPLEEKTVSKKALYFSNFALVFLLFIVLYLVIPGFPKSGALLDSSVSGYMEQLLGENSPFFNGFLFIVLIIVMICSLIYGFLSKNFEKMEDFNHGLAHSFEGMGYAFVLMFFASQMIGILNWTNLGPVIATRIVDFISFLQLSGVALIVVAFLAIVVMTILIPDALTKWALASPIFIPLFMRANVTPDFTQFLFSAADGIGKCVTPFFGFFFILLAFLHKYQEEDVSVFRTLRNLMPTILLFSLTWLLILLGFYMIGLPLGIGMEATL